MSLLLLQLGFMLRLGCFGWRQKEKLWKLRENFSAVIGEAFSSSSSSQSWINRLLTQPWSRKLFFRWLMTLKQLSLSCVNSEIGKASFAIINNKKDLGTWVTCDGDCSPIHAISLSRAWASHNPHFLHRRHLQPGMVIFVNVKHFHVDKARRCTANARHIWVFQLMARERLEECMIVGHVELIRACAVAKASIKVSRLNDVVVAAQLLEINFPLVATALFITVLSTKSLLRLAYDIIFGFVQLSMLLMSRSPLCSHHRTDNVQCRIILRFIALMVDNHQSKLCARFAVNVNA